MFINLTNHPSINWSEKQIKEANLYGKIIDIPYHSIGTDISYEDINKEVLDMYNEIKYIISNNSDDKLKILCQGEYVTTYRLVNMIKQNIKNAIVVSAISERITEEIIENGVTKKISKFDFKGFREY